MKAWRAKQRPKVTQRVLANRLDIDPSIVCKIENGYWKPGRALAAKIESITKVRAASWDAEAPADLKVA